MRGLYQLGLFICLFNAGVADAAWETVEPTFDESAEQKSAPGTHSLDLAAATERLASKAGKPDSGLSLIAPASLAKLNLHQGQVQLATADGLSLDFTDFLSAFELTLTDPMNDSVFELQWFTGQYQLGAQRFAPAELELPDTAPMTDGRIGFASAVPFDRIVLKEIHGRTAGDPEFVGAITFTPARLAGDDANIGAAACQIPLGVAYNVAFAAGLLSFDPAAVKIANRLGYAANIALKFCLPVFEAPPNLTGRVADGVCTKPATQERMQSEYENALGFPIKFDYDWGELGTPKVFHHNTELDVTAAFNTASPPRASEMNLELLTDLTVPGATAKIYDECRVDGSVATSQLDGTGPEYACPYVKDRQIDFPVGRNTVRWRANAKVGVLDLISPAIPGIPASPKVPQYQTVLLRLIKEAGVIGLGVPLGGARWDNVHDQYQQVTIYDEVAPTINPVPQDQPRITTELIGNVIHVQIEADEPGGVSQRNYERLLSNMYEVFDTCDRQTTFRAQYPDDALRSFWPVSTAAQDNTFTITWTAEDPGPNLAGLPNQRITTMEVEVVDIRPPAVVPPPDIVEITTGTVNDLGQPLVFDFVDLNPTITNDAILPLGLGLHEVTWTATDASGNATSAVQIVNIKTNNIDPNAVAQTNSNRQNAVSFEPTTIRLTGNDPDNDPLTFFIEQYPQNGFFVAPLYPYFVEDYRLERATPSDAELLAGCAPNGTGPDYNLPAPTEPSYLTVNDAGTTFVVDRGWIDCNSIPSPNGSFAREQRIAIFDSNGELVSGRNFDNVNLQDLIVDQTNELIYTTSKRGDSVGFVGVFDFDLNSVESYRLENMWGRETRDCGGFEGTNDFCWILNPDSALQDENGVLYVMEASGRIYALDAVREPSRPVMWIADLTDDVTVNAQTHVTADSLAIDSKGFIYASRNNRIYKYSPSTIGADGLPYPGSLVGWMGRCDFDLAPGDEAVCDVANQRSLGYSCTDAICGIDPDIPQAERDFCGYSFSNDGNFGCRTGQFRGPRGIDIDPQDNLYVADSGNQRIQRFTPEGFFAGEAESACDGSCFVLGDFGSPRDVSVNSDHFYVLDPSTNLLHSSLLTPFTAVGPDWAELVYQSDNDFACINSADCIDSLGFSVSDGVRHPDTGLPIRSAAANVEIEVTRNFRPPVATPGLASVVLEDVETAVILDGSELDPLDMLSFNLITPPQHGTVNIVGNQARYLSDPDYVGPDQFEFAAFDGLDESASEAVSVTVLNVNDAPLVSALDDVTVGVGFTYGLRHDFTDPDTDEVHLLTISWGDGVVESEGERDADGTPNGPLLDQGDRGIGRITADHVYTTPGIRTLQVCVQDQIAVGPGGEKSATAQSLEDCAQATVTVLDAPDLAVTVDTSTDTVLPGQLLNYDVAVTNQTPDAGSGVAASNVQLDIALARELDLGSISISGSGCSRNGYAVTCSFASLPVGNNGSVQITGQVPFDVELGQQLRIEAQATLSEEDPTPENQALAITPVVRPANFIVGASDAALLDKRDTTPGDGFCRSEDNVCTLQAAIDEANALPGVQTIAIGSGNYSLTEDSILEITDSVIVLGNGPGRTFITAAPNQKGVFSVNPGQSLRVEDLALGAGGISVQRADLVARNVRFTTGSDDSSFGGAVLAVRSTYQIVDSTFDGNSALDGGALFALGEESSGSLINVTATGNTGSAFSFTAGTHTLQNVTVVGNNGGCCWDGPSGAVNAYGGAQVTISNSIIAGNRGFVVDGNEAPPNCTTLNGGTLLSGGNNLFGELGECGVALLPSDQVTDDALLLPAANNGGGLPTIKPRVSSQAVDAIPASACPATDARGVTRPADGDGDGFAQCDIGALELRNDRLFSSGFE